MGNQLLTPFDGEKIRKIWHDAQWYFSVVDVILFLTDTTNPTSYWSKVRKNISVENEFAVKDGLLLNSYYMLKNMSLSDTRAFGLDKSNAVIEEIPIVYQPIAKLELERKVI